MDDIAKYWVGNGGIYDGVSKTHISDSSGGAGGASLPTTSTDFIIDQNSFTTTGQIITLNAGIDCKTFTCINVTNNPTITGAGMLAAVGNITLASSANINLTNLNLGSQGSGTLTTNGNMIYSITMHWNAGTLNLADTLNTSQVVLGTHTLNTNNYNINTGYFYTYLTNSKTLTLGSSIITCSKYFDLNIGVTGLTVTTNTSTIILTGDGYYIDPGGKTLYNLECQNNSTIKGNNTWHDFKGTAGKTITVVAGTTQTVTSLSGSGTNGNLVGIMSDTNGTHYHISSASNQTVSYWSIKDSTAQGGGTFTANNSANVGGNSGWTFGIGVNIDASSIISTSSIIIPIISIGVNINVISIVSNSILIKPIVFIGIYYLKSYYDICDYPQGWYGTLNYAPYCNVLMYDDNNCFCIGMGCVGSIDGVEYITEEEAETYVTNADIDDPNVWVRDKLVHRWDNYGE